MYNVDELYTPATLEEALDIMAKDPEVQPLAGGTDVVVKMRAKNLKNVKLLSLDRIQELKGVQMLEDGTIAIGAMTTFTKVANDPIIIEKLPTLRTAALAMGGPQIQNVATIGGNVCNGAVSADSAPSLFALESKLVLRTKDSERTIDIADFYLGPGRVDRKPGELLVRILVAPKGDHFGCMYNKFAVRKAMDLAIFGVAATCKLAEDGTIAKATIAMGVAAPVPVRCTEAEDYAVGKIPTEDVMAEIGRLSLNSTKPRDSWRASKRYREALIRTLSGRAVRDAFVLAGGKLS
ncbi:MAG: xanthine dehydrogenase FAD-binding subunit XdhB [Lachnospiraceae bacterium]|nr:xanthine dehydrogenase FAD-binding subunit XdhB [Lachnospiraceae bacterium]